MMSVFVTMPVSLSPSVTRTQPQFCSENMLNTSSIELFGWTVLGFFIMSFTFMFFVMWLRFLYSWKLRMPITFLFLITGYLSFLCVVRN